MLKMLKKLWQDEEGAAAAEYVLVLGLAALAIVAGATLLGGAMNTAFTNSATAVTNANP
jgi:pilus assembly protein Flp/PilA